MTRQQKAYRDARIAGQSPIEAVKTAGYKAAPHNMKQISWRNEHHPEIQAEIQEIVEERMEKAGITREWITQKLVENVERAMQIHKQTDDDGNVIGFKYEGNVANKALELLGKDIGMFIERSITTDATHMTEAEIREQLRKMRAEDGA